MGGASFIAGDWGTSNLRLSLCDAQGTVLDGRTGPGAADSGGRFADILQSLTAPWQTSESPLPTVLCGMVGSNIGWTEAPYVACPVLPEDVADACVAMCGGRVHIVPGLSCSNRFNAPDFLRGEETQILGALHLVEALRRERRLLCLPGTHTKWVVLQDGAVREFLTAPTGELFALLCEHGVLLRGNGRTSEHDADAFLKGLAHFNQFPQAELLHRLFECRSRQLSGEFSLAEATGYLSGLLVASDVQGALSALTEPLAARSVYLIGAPELTRRYAAALGSHGRDTCAVDGSAASLAGLAQVHRRLSRQAAA
ncbi:MAG TPA: 2-dehydro-3-deoxygalactonokinase [Steroidobacteraceae bacterium]|nr:2-dehydro-3-deoxygalactonokinase [Steroidobacteraceae bacterium]